MADMEDQGEGDRFDVERNELIRLMGTAKDDYRKSIIRDSLNSLDSPDRKLKPGSFEPEKLNGNFTKSPPIRPISARLRRPSMNNLDVIQEEKRLSMEKSMDMKGESTQAIIQLDDVYEFSTSSFDPSLSAWNPFNSNLSAKPSRWISTGLMPQFISIDLKLCWLIMDIRVICTGIEAVYITIEGSITRVPMQQENSHTFSFSSSRLAESSAGRDTPSPTIGHGSSKIFGDRLLLTFDKATDVFFIVEKIRIQAVPTGA